MNQRYSPITYKRLSLSHGSGSFDLKSGEWTAEVTLRFYAFTLIIQINQYILHVNSKSEEFDHKESNALSTESVKLGSKSEKTLVNKAVTKLLQKIAVKVGGQYVVSWDMYAFPDPRIDIYLW